MRPGAAWRLPTLASVVMVIATVCGPATAAAAAQPATWNFSQAHVPAAQGPGRDGAGVTVAIVDTWVDLAHPDFGGRVVDEAYCVGQSGSCMDHRYAPDACPHGTHVAGTVASATYGVAPAARILAVQVLSYDPSSGNCSGSTADVAAGIRWAVAHGAQVVNLSLGGLVPGLFQSSDVTGAVHAAASAGVVVVVAAGNESLPLTDSYGSDAVLVAATGPSGQLATYSDRDGSVALAAPGGDDGAAGLNACAPTDCIVSTVPGHGYGLLEGTSMAAPHVSGTAALLIAQDPSRGRADVIHALESTARPLAGAGHGLLDAAAAMSLRAGWTSASPATAPRRASGSGAGSSTAAWAVSRQPAPPASHTATGGAAAPRRSARPAGRPSTTTTVPGSRPLASGAPSAGGAAPAFVPSGRHHRSGSLVWLAVIAAIALLVAASMLGRRLFKERTEELAPRA